MGLLKLLPRLHNLSRSISSLPKTLSKIDFILAKQYRHRLEQDSNPYLLEKRNLRRKFRRWKQLQRFYDGIDAEQLRLFRLPTIKKTLAYELTESQEHYFGSQHPAQGIEEVVDNCQLNLFDENLQKQWRKIENKQKYKSERAAYWAGRKPKSNWRSLTDVCLGLRRGGRTINTVEYELDKKRDYDSLYNYNFKLFYKAFTSSLFYLVAARKGDERTALLIHLEGLTRPNWRKNSSEYLAPILRREIFDKSMIPKVCAGSSLDPDKVFNDLFEEFCTRPPAVRTDLVKYIEN